MNKFILAVDGLRLSSASIDYAIYFAREFNGHIVVVFLEDMGYHINREKQALASSFGYEQSPEEEARPMVAEVIIRNEAEATVRRRLETAGVRYGVHHDPQIALQALLEESNMADLILIDMDASFSNYDIARPSHFMQGVLAGAGCPVILTPSIFSRVERIVFAYDGKPASAFAIRQFSYLFPETDDMQYEILHCTEYEDPDTFPHHKTLQELMSSKYEGIVQTTLYDDHPKNVLLSHLLMKRCSCMLVLGAYEKSAISRWLDPSIANEMIERLNIPIFIAHS